MGSPRSSFPTLSPVIPEWNFPFPEFYLGTKGLSATGKINSLSLAAKHNSGNIIYTPQAAGFGVAINP